jgi:hypothetical protein
MIAIPVPDPSDRVATAIHEAAHAIVARALGVTVTRVTLHPASADRLGVCCTMLRDDPNNVWAQCVRAFAGAVAEQRYARYPPDTLAMMWDSAWKTDRRNAEHYLGQLGTVTMQQAANMAAHLVDRDWSTITRIAQALAEEAELSGVALDRLWRE